MIYSAHSPECTKNCSRHAEYWWHTKCALVLTACCRSSNNNIAGLALRGSLDIASENELA